MFTSNDFILGLVVYEGLLIAALVGSLTYLLVTFYRFKDKIETSVAEITQQNKEMHVRIAQVQAILTIIDTFGSLIPSTALSSSPKTGIPSKSDRLSKNPHRWDVFSSSKENTKESEPDTKKDK